MDGRVSQQLHVGETLPLFEAASASQGAEQQLTNVASNRQTGGDARIVQTSRPERKSDRSDGDRHMHVAWQLSNALEAVKKGRKAGRKLAKLTPAQRHQVGNAICGHLLASLRQQVESEDEVAPH